MRYEVLHLKDVFAFLGEDGRDPWVEIYLPEKMTEMGRKLWKRPCLVICPGGAYRICSQREAEPIAFQFLAEDYNVFVLHYSVAPHCYPHSLREVAGLLEVIAEHQEQWNCDAEKVALMGFSAGGHLAALYANDYDLPIIREKFPRSRAVQASLLCYAVLSGDRLFCHEPSLCNLSGHPELTSDDRSRFSCPSLVTERTPATFLWHSAADQTVPVENSLMYATALSASKVPFEMHIFPFGHHGLATATPQTCNDLTEDMKRDSAWMGYARNWLNMTFHWQN